MKFDLWPAPTVIHEQKFWSISRTIHTYVLYIEKIYPLCSTSGPEKQLIVWSSIGHLRFIQSSACLQVYWFLLESGLPLLFQRWSERLFCFEFFLWWRWTRAQLPTNYYQSLEKWVNWSKSVFWWLLSGVFGSCEKWSFCGRTFYSYLLIIMKRELIQFIFPAEIPLFYLLLRRDLSRLKSISLSTVIQ